MTHLRYSPNFLAGKIFRGVLELDKAGTSDKPGIHNWPSMASVETPEGVVGTCAREIWYKRKGQQPSEDPNPNYRISAYMGNHLEEMVVSILRNTVFWTGLEIIGEQTPFYMPDLNMSGKIDFFLRHQDEVFGVDVKSVSAWKSGKVLVEPDPKHVLQALIYLHNFRNNPDYPSVKFWSLLYISRAETWELKSKKNQSPLVQIWDFPITLDPETEIPVAYTPEGEKRYSYFTYKAIKDRIDYIDDACRRDSPPRRDFQIRYSEEKILGLYKQGKIPTKRDREIIERWIKKGAKEGELGLEMGDAECRLCPFSSRCWKEGTSSVVERNSPIF